METTITKGDGSVLAPMECLTTSKSVETAHAPGTQPKSPSDGAVSNSLDVAHFTQEAVGNDRY